MPVRLSSLSLSPFYFPSLALIFTASFSVYMPERLKEAKHLLPLPPRVRQLFTQPVPSFYITWETRLLAGTPGFFLSLYSICWICRSHRHKTMDSDSDSPFNYSWPAFPKMKIRRRASRQGRSRAPLFSPEPSQASSYS